MNCLHSLDYLSPKITLHYYGKKSHSSSIGGLLTIIMTIALLACAVYFFWILFSHSNGSVVLYKQYEYEAGYFPFNTSSMFHFIQIYSIQDGGIFDEYDKKSFRIFTTRQLQSSSDVQKKIEENDHWLYDKCTLADISDFDKKVFENTVNFTESACLKYYYNSAEKKYYTKGEVGYEVPYLEHGNSRRDNLLLGTVVELCNNNSVSSKILGPCGTKDHINSYLKNHQAIYFQMIDHMINPSLYNNPIEKYIYSISCGINTNTYAVQNINFNPLRVITNKGLLYDSLYEENTFQFIESRKSSKSNSNDTEFILEYDYWMTNNVQIYSRSYQNIYEVISRIGGLGQVIYILFKFLNFLYYNYILLLNTKNLFFRIHVGLDNSKVSCSQNSSQIIHYESPNKSLPIENDLVRGKIWETKCSKNLNFIKEDKSKKSKDDESSLFEGSKALMNLSRINQRGIGNVLMHKISKGSFQKPEDLLIKKDQRTEEEILKTRNKTFHSRDIEQASSPVIKSDLIKINKKGKNSNIANTSESPPSNNINININNISDNKNNKQEENKLSFSRAITKNYDETIINKEDDLIQEEKEKNMISDDVGISPKQDIILKPRKAEENDANDANIKSKNKKTIVQRMKEEHKIKKSERIEKSMLSRQKSNFVNGVMIRPHTIGREYENKNFREFVKEQYGFATKNSLENKFYFENKKLNFSKFLASLIYPNLKKKYGINVLSDFRKKLLSEEHLYRNHINLYYIEKYLEMEEEVNCDIKEVYKNL